MLALTIHDLCLVQKNVILQALAIYIHQNIPRVYMAVLQADDLRRLTRADRKKGWA